MSLAALLLAAATPPFACGAVAHPGIAERGPDGIWRGAVVDICRRVADQADGPRVQIEFHGYDSPAALRAAGSDRLAFLSRAELAALPPDHGMHIGPVVVVDRQVLAVPAQSPYRTPADLASQVICFIIGTSSESALDAWSVRTHAPIKRLAFQEPVEMQDAYDVRKCAAMAIDAADMPGDGRNRPLNPALATTPIHVAISSSGGEDLARLVALVVTPGDEAASGEAQTIPVPAGAR